MGPGTDLVAITVNWNRADDTIDCLNSLEVSGVDPSRIIVVDNGSSDGSPEKVRERMPSVIVMEMDENLGYIKGVNRGISRALELGARNILLINNDATVSGDAVGGLMEAFENHGSAGILGPKILYHDMDRIWFAGGRFDRRWGFSTHPHMDGPDDLDDREERVDFVTGCIMLVRSEVFEDIGLFDEDLWMYAEDLDFCLEAGAVGWESWYIPSSVGYHKVSASSGVKGSNTMTPMRSYYYARNMMVVVHRLPWKEKRFTRLLGQFLVRFPYYTMQITLQGVRGGLRAYAKGLVDGLRWILEGGPDG
jgi:hypothetical protein